MIIKFITALAWFWSGFWTIGLLAMGWLRLFGRESPYENDRTERLIVTTLVFAVPGWAWLIAKYFM